MNALDRGIFEKLLQILIAIILMVNIFVISFDVGGRIYLKESPSFVFTPPIKDICYQGFKTILDREADQRIIKKSIFEEIAKSEYRVFDFEGDEEIKYVGKLNKDLFCLVIVKDTKGLRSFELELERIYSDSYPLGFVIKNIVEIESSTRG